MMRRFAMATAMFVFPAVACATAFSLTDTLGRTHTLEGHRGKWVVVNLWATWCAPCLAEMPELEALSRARSDVVVLGLAADGQSARKVMQFAQKLGVTYPVIAGNADMARPFQPRGFPTSIVYTPSGQQVLVREGPVTRQVIEQFLRRSP